MGSVNSTSLGSHVFYLTLCLEHDGLLDNLSAKIFLLTGITQPSRQCWQIIDHFFFHIFVIQSSVSIHENGNK